MKKILTVLFLAAILYVGYLALMLPRDSVDPSIDGIKAEADKIVDQVTDMYEEYGSEAVEQVAEEADEAIEQAVDSAVEGAKQGFVQSLQKSVSDFFDSLSADDDTGERIEE